MYTKLVQVLTTLKGVGAVGIKTSFEDEGAHPKNVRKLRNVSHLAGLDMSVKIGGAEAKTDFYTAIEIGSDGIVAPMIESPFALSKFTDYSKDFDIKRGINIESKQGIENLESILKSNNMEHIDYICIGRSDLSNSYENGKDYIFSKDFCDIVTDTLFKIKSSDLDAYMGGTLDARSYHFLKFLHDNKLVNKVETRYVMFNLNDAFLNNFDLSIKKALEFEYEYMKLLRDIELREMTEYANRCDVIKDRLSQQIDYL